MNTCSSCKHWAQHSDGRNPVASGTCKRFNDMYKTPIDGIKRPWYSGGGRDSAEEDQFITTGPWFGCIKHEQK